MNPFKDYSLTPGAARTVKIVNHHNKWLNGKVGTLVGRDLVGFYNYKVRLTSELITVIVHQANIVPADQQATRFADVFAIHWMIFWHNVAIKIRNLFTK